MIDLRERKSDWSAISEKGDQFESAQTNQFGRHFQVSDDVLIITGSVIKTKPQTTDILSANLSNERIAYTRRSKEEYLNGLRGVYEANQYKNITFEELEVVQHAKYPELFGVTLKKLWNTTRYSDVGHVFLMIVFKDEENPIIHVRTWQPEKYADGKKLDKDEVFGRDTFGNYNR